MILFARSKYLQEDSIFRSRCFFEYVPKVMTPSNITKGLHGRRCLLKGYRGRSTYKYTAHTLHEPN